MEIALVLFLGLWVTVCSLLAHGRVRKDLRDVTDRGDEQK